MSKAVAELLSALPGSTFDNTGGGCMVVAWPTGGDGAIVITGVYGNSGSDNFSWNDHDPDVEDSDLTGFYAAFHAAWFGEDPQDIDPVDVYESEPFDATADLDIDGWWPADEYAFCSIQNGAHAIAEVPRVAIAAHNFAKSL
ncbi:hypothetical protein J2S40_001153 [Nocardioides luteus]|uniref:DUF3558 domain-containing protein n=1 Tax=Nocardioides luteus TaxID=1844 RepID=A0ABQ5SS85_9ACTN|nr:hypothetical protein [Nocardioides luteus]MDR7310095.1 hypothetical protein [Nocardioides luteus]GGR64817.1 hypothetical protein GCM10010197_35360 [Nocardioides luteus]GLJ66997.1 hypothetical protein GCM10017579_10330 [Nocardioides luteus]